MGKLVPGQVVEVKNVGRVTVTKSGGSDGTWMGRRVSDNTLMGFHEGDVIDDDASQGFPPEETGLPPEEEDEEEVAPE